MYRSLRQMWMDDAGEITAASVVMITVAAIAFVMVVAATSFDYWSMVPVR